MRLILEKRSIPVLALVAVLLAVPFAATPVGADNETEYTVVAGFMELADGEYVLDRPIQVPPGATLTIRNATVHLNYDSFTCFRVNVVGNYCHPAIRVDGGFLNIEDSVITSSRTDEDGHIEPWRIQGYSGVLNVNNSELKHFSQIRFEWPGALPSTVTNSEFHSGNLALWFLRGAQLVVEDNSFHDLATAVSARDTTGEVRGNHFSHVHGAGIILIASVVGEKPFFTEFLVEENLVEHSGTAIHHQSNHASVIRNNTLYNNTAGIVVGLQVGEAFAKWETPTVEYNLLQKTGAAFITYTVGFQFELVPDDVTLTLRNNHVEETVCHDVLLFNDHDPKDVTVTVDARQNWWGSTDGPPTDHGIGCQAIKGDTILTDPWLTSPPAGAGAGN